MFISIEGEKETKNIGLDYADSYFEDTISGKGGDKE